MEPAKHSQTHSSVWNLECRCETFGYKYVLYRKCYRKKSDLYEQFSGKLPFGKILNSLWEYFVRLLFE